GRRASAVVPAPAPTPVNSRARACPVGPRCRRGRTLVQYTSELRSRSIEPRTGGAAPRRAAHGANAHKRARPAVVPQAMTERTGGFVGRLGYRCAVGVSK